MRGQRLRDVLAIPVLDGAVVLAGREGLDRVVERLNVMEVPDIVPWVKPAEFLLTTAYPLHGQTDRLAELVCELDEAGLVGIGIKLGRYLDELPDDVLEVADERQFPIVQLPPDIAFDEILTEVLSEILQAQTHRLERSERIHRALLQIVLDGDGLDRLATDLADILDAPTAVLDATDHVLAAARLPDGVEVGDQVALRDDEVDLGGEALPATSVPISAGHQLHGRVVALRRREGGEAALDRRALEHAATVAALTRTKELELAAIEARYQSELMHDLLSGRLTHWEDGLSRAKLFGWDLQRRLIVLVAQLDDPEEPAGGDAAPRIPFANTLARPIHDRDPAAAVVRFSDEVVVLTGAFEGDHGRDQAEQFVRDLCRETTRQLGTSVSVGLGRPVTELEDVPRAYGQAIAALRIGRNLHGPGAAVHFDRLGAYRLLDLVEDPSELADFATEILGELAGDTETARDLRRTLRVLLEANGNVAAAARRLHFHYNTLRYRIEKIEGIVGPFTDDATLRLDVHLALLILEMHAATRPTER
ncbi:MAG: PucR family transcriptional regulator ligand-binding domain-containing protein [Nitriliruptorales bacterium]|nr:PucR family transcriptional regulator ligand-binding domain-containing protein [Nitriliruptorales bacterium]